MYVCTILPSIFGRPAVDRFYGVPVIDRNQKLSQEEFARIHHSTYVHTYIGRQERVRLVSSVENRVSRRVTLWLVIKGGAFQVKRHHTIHIEYMFG